MKNIDQALLASLDLVFALDVSGRFVYINDLTARFFGGDRSSLTHQPLTQTQLPSAVIQTLSTNHQEIVGSGRPTAGQMELEVSGSTKCYDYTFSPVRGHLNPIEATIFIAKDITERQQAEMALRDSEVKYRTLFESASDIILILDCDTYGVLNANWTAARKLGYSRLELMQLSLHDIEAIFDPIRQAELIDTLELEGNVIYEHLYRRKQGSTFPVEINAQLIEYGDRLCIQSFVRDITERKQAEDAIHEQQQQLAAIAANFPGSLYREVVHPDGTISIPYISDGGTHLTGLTPEQIMDNPALLSESVHPGDRPYVDEELRRCRQTLETLDIEYRNINPDGMVSWLREMARFSRTESGEVVADGFSLNITDRKEAQRTVEIQLEQEKLLRRLSEQIHQSLDLSTTLQTTSEMLLEFFQTERIVIQKYAEAGPCEILNQSVCREELRISSTDLSSAPYSEGTDIEEFHRGTITALQDMQRSELAPQFTQFLKQCGVRSLILAPILLPVASEKANVRTKLWGFLLVHECSQSRQWQPSEIDLIQQIVTQLGIAIHQSELYRWLRNELHERIRAEAEVRSLNAELEQRVAERTQELQTTNQELEQEIRERIRTAEALRQSEQRFRDLVETTNDLVWEEDAQYTITYISPQSQAILGYAPDELIGRSALELMITDEQEFLRQDSERTDWETRTTYEVCIRHKEGHTVILESNQVSLFDENGDFIGCRGIDRDITARKEAEEKLRRYERIVSATTDGISLVDRNYIYQIVNQTYLNRHGRALEDIIDHPVDELFSPDFCEQRVRPNLDRCFAGEVVQYETWVDFAGAGRRYISVNYSPYVETDGSITGAVVSTRDITELKRAEESLASSEAKLSNLFNTAGASIGYFFLDHNHQLERVLTSKGCIEVTGFAPEKLTPEFWRSRVHPDDVDRLLDHEETIHRLLNGELISVEYRFMHKNGSTRWLSDTFTSQRDAANHRYVVTAIAIDITARKKAELALRESESQLQQIFENVQDVFFLKEFKTGRTIFINSAFKTLFQVPRENVYHSPQWIKHIHPEDLDRVLAVLKERNSSPDVGAGLGDMEYRIVRPDGSIRWIWSRTFPIRNEAGEIYRFAGIHTDITERKQAELALRESEAKNRALINALPDLVIRMSRDGTYLDCFSTDTFKVIGTQDWIGKSIIEGGLPAHLVQKQMDAIHQVLNTGNLQIYELEMTIDGDRQIEEVRTVKCDNNSVIVLVRDITDRKQAEEALQQSEARFQTLVTNMPGMVYRHHPGMAEAGTFTYVSAGSEALLELTTEQVLQDANAVWSLIHPDDIDSFRSSTAFAVEHCLPWQWEGRLTTPSGQHKWMQGRSRPQETSDGIVWDGILLDTTARVQAELDLSHRTQELQAIFDVLPDLYFRIDWQGTFLDCRCRDEELLHAPPSEFIGRNIRDILPADICEKSQLAIARAIATDDVATIEYQLEMPGGIRDFEARFVTFHDDELIVIARDITDRKQAEIELRNSEQRYSSLTAHAPVGIFRTNTDGDCIYLNPQWCALAGISETQALGRGWLTAIHPDDRERARSAWYEAARQQVSFSGEFRFLHPDGAIVWFTCIADVETDGEGCITGYVGTVTDITQRKQAEDDLRKSERRYATLTEMSPVGIFRFDADGRCVYLNSRWYEITGLSVGEGYGTDWTRALHPEDRDRILANWENAYAQRMTLRSEGRHLIPDGSIKWFDCQMVPEFDANGELLGYIGTVSDITEKKQAEQALQLREARLRTLVDTLPFGVWARDGKSRVMLQNPVDIARFGNILGTLPEEIDVLPEILEREREFQQRGQLGEVVTYESTETIEGEERSFLRLMTRMHDEDGQLGILGVSIDITERKQTERALQISEQRLRTLVDTLPLGVWVRDADDRLVLQNTVDMARYGNKLGTSLEALELSQELRSHYEAVKRRCQAGEVVSVETTESIHGEEHTFLRINATLPDFEGGVGIFGATIDITDRKRAEQALAISEERFRAMFENAGIGIVLLEAPEWKLTTTNPALQRLLGYGADELATLGHADVTHPDDLAVEAALFRDCIEGDRNSYELEKRYIRKDGDPIWVHLTASIVRDEQCRAQRGIFTIEDITARKRSEEAVCKATNALLEVEARQRLILEAIPDLLHLFDENGTLLDSIRNVPGKNLLPNPGQVIGRNLLELIPQALAEQQIQAIQTALETNEIQIYEQQIDRNAFPEFREQEGVSFIPDDPREMHYEEVRIIPTANRQVLILVRDISERKWLEAERKHAELALAQSEYRQRMILRTIPELIGWFNKDGMCLDWYSAQTVQDLIPDDVNPIGKSYREILPPDVVARLTRAIQQAIETGIEQHYDQQIQFGDTLQHEEVIVMPTDNDEALLVVRDVSDRKVLENHLRSTQRTLQDILDHIDAAIVRLHMLDSGDLTTDFISARCESVFGYTPEELMGDRSLWMSRVNPDDLETIVIPSRQRICEAGHDSITYRFQHKNGEIRQIHSRAIAHRDDAQQCWIITAIETLRS